MTLETIMTLIGSLGTLTATVTGVLYWRQNRRIKEAEARREEAETQLKTLEVREREEERYNKRVDVLHEDIDTLNTQLTNAYKDKARAEEIIDDKTAKIRELNDTIFALQKQLVDKENLIGRLKLFIQWLKHWHCKRETGKLKGQCTRRLPEQSVPTPFQEYPDKSLLADLGVDDVTTDVGMHPGASATDETCASAIEVTE